MSIRLLIIMFLLSTSCNSQHKTSSDEFEKFKGNFPIQTTPYNTSSLNKYDTYLKFTSERKQLDPIQCANIFFNGDKSKLIYEYENFNMETGESKGVKKDNFSFYPIFRLVHKELILLGFLRESANSYEYFLSAFANNSNKANDLLEINKVHEELLPELFEFSVIDSSLVIKIFRYEQNPKYWQELKSKKDEANKSLLTSMSYKFDIATLKFIQLKKEFSVSRCTVSQFLQEKPECIKDDPFKNQHE